MYWVIEPGFKGLKRVPEHCMGLYPGAEKPWKPGASHGTASQPGSSPLLWREHKGSVSPGHRAPPRGHGWAEAKLAHGPAGALHPASHVGNRTLPQPGVKATLLRNKHSQVPQTEMKGRSWSFTHVSISSAQISSNLLSSWMLLHFCPLGIADWSFYLPVIRSTTHGETLTRVMRYMAAQHLETCESSA